MKNFRQFIKELPSNKVVFAFGRFQPPTTGHELLVKAVKKLAGSTADHVIYASKTEDKKDNPLPVARKVYFLKRMFPNTNFKAADAQVRTFIEAAKELNKRYKNIVMVAGSDRVAEYEKILNKYNGTEFHFDTVEVVSAGERDPDSDSASGMSGTKMRDAAKKGNFKQFKKGVPATLTDLDARRLMNDIRTAYGMDPIKESVQFERSKIREKYIAGKIFNVGDKVQDENGIYEIMDRGANYITVVNESGELSKKWIDKVTTVKNIAEDIPGGYAPEEITFKGYTTKNLHHSADAAMAFQQTIHKYDGGLIKDGVAIMNALKATDTYMKLNDLHLEQGGKAPDEKEMKEWVDAHVKARESLERIGEFLHHMDYWDSHGHELQMLLTDYKDLGWDSADESFTIEGNMIQEELKFAAADKIKVARIIATTFGVEGAEKSSSAENMVNNGLRKIRTKSFTPDMAKVIKNMLDTARLAGIDFDEKLVPQKVTDAINQATMKEESEPMNAKSIMRYKEYTKNTIEPHKLPYEITHAKKKSMETDMDDMDPNDTDDKDNQSDQDTAAKKDPETSSQSKVGGMMVRPFSDDENLRRQKIKYTLGEALTDSEKAAKETAKANLAAKQAAEKEALANKQAKEKEALSEEDDNVTRSDYKVTPSGRKVHKQLRFKSFANGDMKEDIAHVGTVNTNKVNHAGDEPHEEKFEKFKGLKSKNKTVEVKENILTEREDDEYHTPTKHHVQVEISKGNGKREHRKATITAREPSHAVDAALHHYKKQGYTVHNHKYLGESVELSESHAELDKHISTFSKGVKSSAAKHSTYKNGGGKIHNMKHVETDSDHHAVFKHLQKMGYKKTSGYDPKPHEFDMHHNRDSMTSKSDPVHHSSGVSAHVEKEHGGKTKVHFTHRGIKESAEELLNMLEEAAKAIDSGEYDYEGQMARTQLQTILRNSKDLIVMIQDDENMPEWVQSKITLAQDYITTVRDYLQSKEELGEEIKKKNKKIDDKETLNVNTKGTFDPFFEEKEEESEEDPKEAKDLDELSDEEIEKMVDKVSEDDIIDEYDEDELEIVDAETGETVEHEEGESKDTEKKEDKLKEDTLMEVLSRSERMRAKIRFMKSASKRKRSLKIALRSHSSTDKINSRARRLAIKLMKQRIAKRPLASLSVGEKERLERIVQRRKKVVNRIAMKLAARVRKVENDRLSRKKSK